ncbi:LacI family DNA-binding transcriptional regulator [Citreicella sp. C3M06]|uniref:LacI family DNA-binding transcriptional regulator n=1 Tax=Roseobacteraceae TaxID=2854170 RepID=UPI001C08D928|nr:LacI family DNA-binding transcriptional regulator [Salipiger sp. 1_MG-2023]MBU2961961.1 LacI family DNA-binding transcriptional regulator [Citreicella sp. C3M06]MDO6586382.1 LacI family DNA-binding transcriptional regulator [Salipiger sp. 1_MG-2023]
MADDATRPLTLRDVSEASGVSEMTVSRVLRNRGDVSEATRAKVLQAAKELGYVPNKIAGALASQRVNLVAVIIPSMRNMVFPEVMAGITSVLEHTELQPVVGVTDYEPEKEERVLYEMLSWRPSGIIIAGIEHTEASKAMLKASGIPVIEIMDTDGTPIDTAVGISHRRAGREMANAILKAGYQKIGFLGTKMPLDFRARKRFEGFTEALAKGGVEIAASEFYSGGSALAKGREMTAALLEKEPELDFIYYSNDMIGAGGLLYLLEQGRKIPSEIGLAGFNGVELLQGLPKKLATMDACRTEIGIKAAEVIAARVNDPSASFDKVIEMTPKIAYGDTLRR